MAAAAREAKLALSNGRAFAHGRAPADAAAASTAAADAVNSPRVEQASVVPVATPATTTALVGATTAFYISRAAVSFFTAP